MQNDKKSNKKIEISNDKPTTTKPKRKNTQIESE